MPPETRKELRQKTENVVVRYGSATVDEFIEAHAQDVIRTGTFVRTKAPPAVGTLITFEIQIATEVAVVVGVGRVVWKRDAADGDRPAGIGVKFIDVDEPSQAILDRLLLANKKADNEFEPRPRTEAGLGPPLTEDEVDRAITSLGLAPPAMPASLVLDDQSEPITSLPFVPVDLAPARVEAPPEAPGALAAPSTKVPTPPAAVPVPRSAPAPAVVAVPRSSPPAARPASVAPRSSPPPQRTLVSAAAVVDPPRPPARWPWAFAVAVALAAGVYYFRAPLHEAGLLPDIPARQP